MLLPACTLLFLAMGGPIKKNVASPDPLVWTVIAVPAATWAGMRISEAEAPNARDSMIAMRNVRMLRRDPIVVVYHHVIAVHVFGNIRRQINCKRRRYLWQ